MSKPKASKLPWDTRAQDALAGRLKLDPAELLTLVNEVNPTGRGRDARETAARYALKARLESLLVLRFLETLDISRDPDDPEVISIRLRAQPRFACHAVLDSLDEEARSLVRRRLDLDAVPPSSEPTEQAARDASSDDDVDSRDPDACSRTAARAEQAYDFELAERLYRRAFEERPEARTALALLRLLVDVVAADRDALEVEGALPAAARAHGGVRVLLGLAAARSGDEARARSFVAHSEEPRAAEVLVLLARHALGRGDTAAAGQRLAEARAVDPSAPMLAALDAEIVKAREAERAPHEAELARLMLDEREPEATSKAAAILARWPDSDAARRAARTLEARRQSREGQRLLSDAEAARGRGETSAARSLIQRALAGALDDAARAKARQMAGDLEAQERDHEASRRVERVVTWLGGSDRARGLAAYAELPDALKARVRASGALPSLDWIDAMIRAEVRDKLAVEAARALERAEALEEADPSAALALLSPHERALQGIASARALVRRARGRQAEAHRREAREALLEAERALDAGDAERGERLLERAERDLGDEDRALAGALRARLASQVERRGLERRYERMRAARRYADATLAAEALSGRSEGPERERWIAAGRAVREDLERDLRPRIYDLDGGAECSRDLYFCPYPGQPPRCIDPERGVFVVASGAGRYIFVRWFSIETGRLKRLVRLLATERSGNPGVELSGDVVLVTMWHGGIVELSADTGEPLRWMVIGGECVDEALLPAAGSRYLWLTFDDNGARYRAIHDREGERPARAMHDAEKFYALPGLVPPRVAAVRHDEEERIVSISLHEPGGSQTARFVFNLEDYFGIEGLALHPSGAGLLVVLDRRDRTSNSRGRWICVELSPRGEQHDVCQIPDVCDHMEAEMACARDLGMLFMRVKAKNQVDDWLLALSLEQGAASVRVEYRVPLGARRFVAQEPQGRRVYLVEDNQGAIRVAALGREPPVPAESRPTPKVTYPLQSLWACLQPDGVREVRVRQIAYKDSRGLKQRALDLRTKAAPPPDEAVDMLWALVMSREANAASELAEWLAGRFPDIPEVGRAAWLRFVVGRRWQELIATLAPMDPSTMPETPRKHWHHLLAAAYFVTGDGARGRQHIAEGVSLPGRCDFTALQEIGGASAEEPPPAEVPIDRTPIQQYTMIIRAADVCLARDDLDGVLALFERQVVWESYEVQSMARLAAAHLARPVVTDVDRVRAAVALAHFTIAVAIEPVNHCDEVVVPGAVWPRERLVELAQRAKAWLEGA